MQPIPVYHLLTVSNNFIVHDTRNDIAPLSINLAPLDACSSIVIMKPYWKYSDPMIARISV